MNDVAADETSSAPGMTHYSAASWCVRYRSTDEERKGAQ